MSFIPNREAFEGYGEIVIAAVLWGFAGILAKKITGMPAQSIIFYRVTFAFVLLFIVMLFFGNLKLVKLKDKKTHLVLFSLMQAATMLTYFISIMKASVSVAVLLLYTAPVYVTVLSPLLLKESYTKRGIIALVLSITGILSIIGPVELNFSQYSIGIAAGILSGIAYSFQIMTSKYISRTYSGYAQAFWSFLIASIILLPWGIAPVDVVFGNIIYLILLAIFPTILAVSLYFNGLKFVRASSASILALLEPLSAVILAFLILDEKLSIQIVIGGALILAGGALVTAER